MACLISMYGWHICKYICIHSPHVAGPCLPLGPYAMLTANMATRAVIRVNVLRARAGYGVSQHGVGIVD